jgi:Ala-tRNA(Pro) deacylase
MPATPPATRTELFQFLDQLGITTATKDHIPVFTVEDAQAVHGDMPGGHCKNLFCKDEKGALWLIVMLEDSRINLKTVPDKIGSRRLSFGKPDLLMEVLGVEPGSVTPFALINDKEKRCNVILDHTMMQHALLNYHPLGNTATTAIARDDLVTFVKACGHAPRIIAVSEPFQD